MKLALLVVAVAMVVGSSIGLGYILMSAPSPPDTASEKMYSVECSRTEEYGQCMYSMYLPYHAVFRTTKDAVITGASFQLSANPYDDAGATVAFRVAWRVLDGSTNVSYGSADLAVSRKYQFWFTLPAKTNANLSSAKNYDMELWVLRGASGYILRWGLDHHNDNRPSLVVWGGVGAVGNYMPGGMLGGANAGSTSACDPLTEHEEGGRCVKNSSEGLPVWAVALLVVLLVSVGILLVAVMWRS